MKIGIAVQCSHCHIRKSPIGRSVPLEMYLCDQECEGYYEKPFVGSLWPGETEEEFGYLVGLDGWEEKE